MCDRHATALAVGTQRAVWAHVLCAALYASLDVLLVLRVLGSSACRC